MFETSFSESTDIPLDTLLARLRRHPDVDALLLVGSSASRPGPASDIDLLIVVDAMPVAVNALTTQIGTRQGVVHLMTTERIEQYLAQTEPFDANDRGGFLVSWLRTGRILYDRSGRLHRLADRTYSDRWLIIREDSVYDAWYRVNLDVRYVRWLGSATDPLTVMAVDARMLAALYRALTAYFTLRRIPWRGEKAAFDYLQHHDPGFWDRFEVCLNTPDRAQKMALYETLAALALDPAGGVWEDDETAVELAEPPTGDALGAGLEFWEQLVTLSERD